MQIVVFLSQANEFKGFHNIHAIKCLQNCHDFIAIKSSRSMLSFSCDKENRKLCRSYIIITDIYHLTSSYELWLATVQVSSLLGYPLSVIGYSVKRRSAEGLALDLKAEQINCNKQVETEKISDTNLFFFKSLNFIFQKNYKFPINFYNPASDIMTRKH